MFQVFGSLLSDGGMDNETIFDLTFDQEVTFNGSFADNTQRAVASSDANFFKAI